MLPLEFLFRRKLHEKKIQAQITNSEEILLGMGIFFIAPPGYAHENMYRQ